MTYRTNPPTGSRGREKHSLRLNHFAISENANDLSHRHLVWPANSEKLSAYIRVWAG
jgi:hypothetical protein